MSNLEQTPMNDKSQPYRHPQPAEAAMAHCVFQPLAAIG